MSSKKKKQKHNKHGVILVYRHAAYLLTNKAGLLRNGRFKTKEFLDSKEKFLKLKYSNI